jgi:proteasome lid subunit RPN8/RPN11
MAEQPVRTLRIDSSVASPARSLNIQPSTRVQTLDLENFGRRMTFHHSQKEKRESGDCDVVMSQEVYLEVVKHLSQDTSREHGGLLLGFEENEGTPEARVWVMRSLPARFTDGSPTRLDIKEDSWAEWNREEATTFAIHGYRRVGWYHSHPNIEIFLSKWDLDVCKEFRRPMQVAMVVDPIAKRGGFFVRGEKGFREHALQSFWELNDFSPAGRSVVEWTNVTRRDEEETTPRIKEPGNQGPERSKPVELQNEGVANTLEQTPVPNAERDSGGLTPPERVRVEQPKTKPFFLAALVVWAAISLPIQIWQTVMLRSVAGHDQRAPGNSTPRAPVTVSSKNDPPSTPAEARDATPPSVPKSASEVTISISPAKKSLKKSEKQQFAAKLKGTSNQDLVWSIKPVGSGTINQKTGFYTAPAEIAAAAIVTITATSVASSSSRGTAEVSLVPTPPAAGPSTGSKKTTPAPAPVEAAPVSVTPKDVSLKGGQLKTFSVTGISESDVEWSPVPETDGSIAIDKAKCTYKAPDQIDAAREVKLVAKSKSDSAKIAFTTIKLTPP